MTAESHPNSPARSKTYRLLLANSQLQEILAGYTAIRHGVSLDRPAQMEMLTITNERTGQVEQMRVELAISDLVRYRRHNTGGADDSFCCQELQNHQPLIFHSLYI